MAAPAVRFTSSGVPIAAIRGEGTSNDYFPPEVPALPAFALQKAISTTIREIRAVKAGSEIDTIVDNSPEEIVAATDDMLSATANVATWREAGQARPVAPQQPFTWPPAYHAPRARVWAR